MYTGGGSAAGRVPLLAVAVLGVRVPRQALLVEGDDNLGTLEVGLLGQHQVGLVRVLPEGTAGSGDMGAQMGHGDRVGTQG